MNQRLARINELLKREISTCLERNFEFSGVLVTVHAVDISVDLKLADVFIGVIGDKYAAETVLDKLQRKRGFIQNTVMKRVTLRQTPQLHFKMDDSVERGVRVLNVLEEIGEVDVDTNPIDDEIDLSKL
ncbi:MAG: 30S ribosome-binding factor RbfA [Verrucomicrobiota bacterium]